jgi:succinate-acetate transporter protein
MNQPTWVPANPAPLGLAGFGLTTLLLSLVNANLIGMGAEPVLFGLAFAYGGLAQFMAGMWEFRTGNTFGATAFSSYGAFWISFFILVTFDAKLIAPSEVDAALGAYLWAWGILTGLLFLASFKQPVAVTLVFLALTVTFVLLGIGNSGASTNTIHAGGWAGIVTAGLALYTAAALVMHHQYGRYVFPIFPRS